VEQYEIAGYGCVRAYATRLGEEDATTLLSQTLDEEKEADETLNVIAEELNLDVPQESLRSEKRAVKSSKGRTRSAA
jgi:ferritin-like metal-binding protein YciE